MHMSSIAKLRLMNREKKMVRYYDDLGPGKGNCTMGIGHLVHRKPCSDKELAQKVIDQDIADGFESDVRAAENSVSRNVTAPLSQEQFDGLVSYTFNRGPSGSLAAYRLINAGDFEGVASEMRSRVKVRVKRKGKMIEAVLPGLVTRRAEESAPFMRKQNSGRTTK
jgi:lysozyme